VPLPLGNPGPDLTRGSLGPPESTSKRRLDRLIRDQQIKKGKGSPYSITEGTVPELIPVLCSQPAGDVSHKPGGRLPLLSARPAVTSANLKRDATNFALGKQRHTAVNSLPKTVTRQRRDCDLRCKAVLT